MTQHCACCGSPFEPARSSRSSLLFSARLPACPQAPVAAGQAPVRSRLPDQPARAPSRRGRSAIKTTGAITATTGPSTQRNREQQRSLRDANGADVDLAKMDVCDLPTGLYRITRHPAFRGKTAIRGSSRSRRSA